MLTEGSIIASVKSQDTPWMGTYTSRVNKNRYVVFVGGLSWESSFRSDYTIRSNPDGEQGIKIVTAVNSNTEINQLGLETRLLLETLG